MQNTQHKMSFSWDTYIVIADELKQIGDNLSEMQQKTPSSECNDREGMNAAIVLNINVYIK